MIKKCKWSVFNKLFLKYDNPNNEVSKQILQTNVAWTKMQRVWGFETDLHAMPFFLWWISFASNQLECKNNTDKENSEQCMLQNRKKTHFQFYI